MQCFFSIIYAVSAKPPMDNHKIWKKFLEKQIMPVEINNAARLRWSFFAVLMAHESNSCWPLLATDHICLHFAESSQRISGELSWLSIRKWPFSLPAWPKVAKTVWSWACKEWPPCVVVHGRFWHSINYTEEALHCKWQKVVTSVEGQHSTEWPLQVVQMLSSGHSSIITRLVWLLRLMI